MKKVLFSTLTFWFMYSGIAQTISDKYQTLVQLCKEVRLLERASLPNGVPDYRIQTIAKTRKSLQDYKDFYSKIDTGTYTIQERLVAQKIKKSSTFAQFWRKCANIKLIWDNPIDERVLQGIENQNYAWLSALLKWKSITTTEFQDLTTCLAAEYKNVKADIAKEEDARETVAAICAIPAQPGVLHHVLGLAARAEHAVGNGLQPRAQVVEGAGGIVHAR